MIKIHDKAVRIPIADIRPNPWNPNEMSEATFEKERKSIRDFGFIGHIWVRQIEDDQFKYEIVDGEHRFDAARAESMDKIPAVVLSIDDATAKQLTLLGNIHGEARRDWLGELLADLSETVGVEQLIERLPYSEGEIRNLLSTESIDWGSLSSDAPVVIGEDSSPEPPPKDKDKDKDKEAVPDGKKRVTFILDEETLKLLNGQIDRANALLFPEPGPSGATPEGGLKFLLEFIKDSDIGDGEEEENS